MSITKLDVAEREIVAAVRLLFDGSDTVPVYVLAAAAREIATTLCNKRGIESYLDIAEQEHPHLSRKEIYEIAGRHARFFKHADRDPDATLTDYSEDEATHALFIASHDFGLLCGGKPVEAQVFDCWYMAIYFPVEAVAPKLFELMPGIREATSRDKQIELGRNLLAWGRSRPDFEMSYSTA